jgi:hypothetical protein
MRPGGEDGRRWALTESDDVARGIAHFQVVQQSDGRYHWELINPHGTPSARSMETFATEDDAVADAEHVRQLISGAPVKRP